ncbi:MAG: hypothetical protein QOJ94_2463 [Sphingomonadales bacterium]|jgi:hypothetical protein|nr:hypothetical protein [Sphingomonadales bacterium]
MATAFCTKLASIAEDQHTRFHLIHETDEPLRSQIKRFWTELGFAFPGVKEAWSAVFISWCVKQAGATKSEFLFAPMHAAFVRKAIKNAAAKTGMFRAFEIGTAKPEVGDIIQNNRGGNAFTFAHAAAHDDYPSHSAIVVETGTDNLGRFALTIGGNESDSVRQKRVPLTAAGFVAKRAKDPYICVIKDLK